MAVVPPMVLEFFLVRKRLKILIVTPESLADLLRLDETRRIRIDGMPADARIVKVSDEIDRNRFAFLVESTTFPEIEEGQPIPRMELTVREWFDGPADRPTLSNRLGAP